MAPIFHISLEIQDLAVLDIGLSPICSDHPIPSTAKSRISLYIPKRGEIPFKTCFYIIFVKKWHQFFI